MGIVTGSGEYIKDSTVIITATPYTGYRFMQWNDGDMQNPRSITVTQDSVFTAIFKTAIYHVIVLANDTMKGTITGGGNYIENGTATITATPYAGYRFVQWNDGDTNNPRTITVTQDISFTAIFGVQGMLSVFVTENDPNMGSVSGGGNYAKDTIIVITAIPNIGRRFVQWSDGNTDNPRTITVTRDITFIAIFEEIKHHITVTANNTSMGTVTGSGDYLESTTVTIAATPYPAYRFVRWNDNNTDNPRSIIVMQDSAFTAIFESNIFHVTVLVNDATKGAVTGGGDYIENSTATIIATPHAGYRFVQWNDGNTDNPRTITVTQDISFTAIFGIEGLLFVSVTENNPNMGSVSGGGDYARGSIIVITALPNVGHRFVQWNDGNTQNSRTITVTQDTSFTAMFEVNRYHVTVSTIDVNMGSVTGSGDYLANTSVTITATPYYGYQFVQWQDGITNNPRSFILTQDTSFNARFKSSVGITDKEISAINIYPNLVTDNITITLPNNVAHAVFTLYDMQSKLLIRQEINNREAISVSNLASGIYIYNIRTENGNYQGKIVKQ
jgi:hypothetical protein